MTSPFGSISQAQVLETVKVLGYAAGAAVCTTLLNLIPTWHLSGVSDVLITSALVPALHFAVQFFSGTNSSATQSPPVT